MYGNLSNTPPESSTAPSIITPSGCLPRTWLTPPTTRSRAVSKQLCGTGSYDSSTEVTKQPAHFIIDGLDAGRHSTVNYVFD